MERSDLANASTADLVRLATEQVRDLARDEVQLAKAEMAEKGKQVGVGAGMFGAAAVMIFYGSGAFLAAAALALTLVLPGWASALIVGGGLFLIAGIAALVGLSRVRRGAPAAPEDAIKRVRADVSAVSAAFKQRRHA